jgi:hypothetical protein
MRSIGALETPRCGAVELQFRSVAASAATATAATTAATAAAAIAAATPAATTATIGAATTAATAAAVRTATSPATAGTAAAVTTTAAATTPTKATGALFARAGFVDHDGAPFERLAVHAVDGGLRLGVRTHLDKAEALGSAGITVHHDLGGRDGAELRKRLMQRFISHGVGEIADVKFVSHGEALDLEQETMWSFNPARNIQAKAPHPTHAYTIIQASCKRAQRHRVESVVLLSTG